MNLPFTSFEPISFLIARFIAVLIGIALFLFIQKFIYGDKNARNELAESTRNLAQSMSEGLSEYLKSDGGKRKSALDLAMEFTEKSKSFNELLVASAYGVHQSSVELNVAKKIDRIRNRIIQLLLDNSFMETNDCESRASSMSFKNIRLLKIQKVIAAFAASGPQESSYGKVA
jgi:hypothetical protein